MITPYLKRNAFENQKPIYLDVATGDSTTGPESVEGFAGYQRLAP